MVSIITSAKIDISDVFLMKCFLFSCKIPYSGFVANVKNGEKKLVLACCITYVYYIESAFNSCIFI